MKQIEPQVYFKALEAVDQTKRSLLESTVIYDSAEILLKNSHPTLNPQKIVIPVGNHVLGLCTTEELLEEFTNIGITDAYGFFKQITDAINKQPAPTTPQPDQPTPPLEETRPGLRTMPMDMQASVQHQQPPATPIPPPNIPTQNPPQGIPTYQSSQEAIFTPPTEAQQPYTPPTPRWDTDNRQ